MYLLNIVTFVSDVGVTLLFTAASGEPSKHKRRCMKLLTLLLEI
jgi:hypothetical protein